jgi:adenylate cyclase
VSEAAATRDEWGEWTTIVATVPFAVRTSVGLAALAIGANVIGAVIIGVLIALVNTSVTHHQAVQVSKFGVVLVAVSAAVGIGVVLSLQRRTLKWMIRGQAPDERDTRRVIRLPFQMATLTGVIWAVDASLLAVAGLVAGVPAATALTVAAGVILGGFTAAGITYLLVTRASQPVLEIVLRAHPPIQPALGMRSRLLLYWLLTSAMPLFGIMLVLTQPDLTQLRLATLGAIITALSVGLFANTLLARSLGTPMRTMVAALHQIGSGDLTVAVPVSDAHEIGFLQTGINDMVTGLRERDRVQDLFGRHVGPAVAAEALRSGVTLSGETKHVVALFVDITSSTALTRRIEPTVFVEMLNRFFDVVVTEVESHGGLVNKFEGDAALCIFGAPVELIDASTAALSAARRIRDRVRAADELAIGIGVAAGPVVAGQIGAASRLEYTVIGDAVNEAARLTDLAKGAAGSLVASDHVVRLASPVEREYWRYSGEVTLRGREVATRIWTA